MSRILFHKSTSRSRMASGLIFKSLIHFELISVNGRKQNFSITFLHVDTSFPNTIY